MQSAVVFAMLMIVYRGVDGDCVSGIPTTGGNAVQVSFYRNANGGTAGQDCPADCTGTPIKQQWYAIADAADACFQWPGNSGENSMRSGTCNACTQSYTYSQWTNCACSGAVGAHKDVHVAKCVIDTPSTLCVKLTDITACGQCNAPTPVPAATTTPNPLVPTPTSAACAASATLMSLVVVVMATTVGTLVL